MRWLRALTAAALASAVALAPAPAAASGTIEGRGQYREAAASGAIEGRGQYREAAAFGTIEGGGQHREHERITRAAIACRTGAGFRADCFAPRSTAQLAGHDRKFGAVGAPDSTEIADPAAHCDDADFLAGGYPRTRDQATAALLRCVAHLRRRFAEAVTSAGGVLDGDGRLAGAEVALDTDCELDPKSEPRAKCEALEAFGRALHGVQDFYAHSNWADDADPALPPGAGNPPGLNRPAPSPVLDLRGTGTPAVPGDLATGCFVLKDSVPGTGACAGRVTHAALNKDNGLVDPDTGGTTAPATRRGLVLTNFAKAVTGAIVETRHQWQELRAALRQTYGAAKGELIACALTRDDPATDCRRTGSGVAPAALVAVLIGLIAAGYLWRRRATRRG
ncbi:CinY protein [Actinoplanes oblitus]|uniref:CinY protein n=1 Tax=Actinoplanes oblitus TaxID=3040509 RepID=A0ABY8WDJ4_9ACTN|nr:CinY protein [Actinoplanes oblitus]WIM94543.1 CinY protein [Actinoplanes oblitus]